jgi:hypothetical protein
MEIGYSRNYVASKCPFSHSVAIIRTGFGVRLMIEVATRRKLSPRGPLSFRFKQAGEIPGKVKVTTIWGDRPPLYLPLHFLRQAIQAH